MSEVSRARWHTLECIRAFALLWVVLVHIAEQVFPGWELANPTNHWPPLADRVAQLAPFTGYGIWDIPAWLLVNFALAGDQAVAVFLILSGFGLAWGASAQRADGVRWGDFLRQRLARVYPEYWMAHLFILVGAFVFREPIQSDISFLFSLLGIRVTPDLLYAVSVPWWFIGLIIQLYLVFPLLWMLQQRLGWQRFALITIGASVAIRTVGLWVFADVVPQWDYVDAWSRGALFITRLPEFVFGMALAAAARQTSPERVSGWCRAPATLLAAAAAYALGMVLALFLLGNGPAIFLLGVGAFLLLFALLQPLARVRPAMAAVNWLSRHSYAIYLVHFAVIAVLIPHGTPLGRRLLLMAAVALAATAVLALLLEWATGRAAEAIAWVRRLSRRGTAAVAGAVAAVWLLLIGAELAVRQADPQEVNGWGERASLQEDPRFGWRMIPDRTTRLRWQGYDYRVSANALGFPGPLYPPERSAETLRIMTIGDAFTSAEGVDTDAAWPRLLEHDLAEREGSRPVQVQNFAMTGYGPNQYAAVARAYLPVYRPDVLVVTLFVNDFDDAGKTDHQFQQSIGFGRTPGDSLYAILTLGDLSAWAQDHLQRLIAGWRGVPAPMDAVHSQLKVFRPQGAPADAGAQQRVRERLAELKQLAADNGARLLLLLVPANIQVCSAEAVYGPGNHFDLRRERGFDLEQPQREFAADAAALDIQAVDLRPALLAQPCPYQVHNMHWTEAGQQRVAVVVARLLAEAPAPVGRGTAALLPGPTIH